MLYLASLNVSAAVTRIEIGERGKVAGGSAFGSSGAYEYVLGKVHFAADPELPTNSIVADIGLAPRDAAGKVEFSADFYIMRPSDATKGNQTALVEISNRGGKGLANEFDFAQGPVNATTGAGLGDGFLLRQGFTLVWVGWEFDVPARAGALRAYVPIATELGSTITGMVRSEWTGDQKVRSISLGDKGQIGYAVLDPNSAENVLFERQPVLGERSRVPHVQWKFIDARHVELAGGFAPGHIYEVVYRTKDPPVAGLGLAAVRDFVSYLRYGGVPSGLGEVRVDKTLGFGISQSGRFLREYLYDGFNEDEQRRRVFDGVWAQVAGAGRGSFNRRFAQPSRDGHEFNNVFYPVDVPPFDEESLLEKARRDHVAPKLFLTNGSYEYWNRCASLIHTTADGNADAPPSDNTRIYFFSGSQHTNGSIPPRPAPAQNPTDTNDYRYGMRALLLAMERWIDDKDKPPASQFPRLDKGELVTLHGLHFPRIENLNVPRMKREAFRLDFSAEPPKVGAAFPTFVPQVDADGNELGGIQMPEVAVPLASYTGWNLRIAEIGSPRDMLPFFGSWIPFPLTDGERRIEGDPRRSGAARYPSEADYLRRIDAAAENLVEAGWVLREDLPSLHERAAKEWHYRQSVQ